MLVSKVLVVPGAGHCGHSYTRGPYTDMLAEVDVVDLFLDPFLDRLEEYNLRHDVAPTRKPPGIPQELRLAENEVNTLKIEMSVGYFDVSSPYAKPRGRNESTVEYAGDCLAIAEVICECLSEWGRVCSFGHIVRKPIKADFAEGCIRIKPFAINGPDVDMFAKRSAVLGEELGLALALSLSDAKRGKPAMV